MEEPRCIKEVQRLNGRIIALGRFISKSAEKCLPFFKALKGKQSFDWTIECSEAFTKLKEYLTSPPLLVSPEKGDELLLYLATSHQAVAAVLVKETNGTQHPVFYVSKALSPIESRYLNAEKLAYSLVIAARKLRAYFSSHTIIVMTNSPLRQILHRPDLSGRLLKWAIELTEFDIRYQPKRAIKAQSLADFIVESSFREQVNTEKEHEGVPGRPGHCWQMYVDGASGQNGCGAGIILWEPGTSEEIEKALRLNFNASNNQAEYEAVIAGLKMAKEMGVENIEVFCDSQVVVNQVNGSFEARHDILRQYLEIVNNLKNKFQYCVFKNIPRQDNQRADYLSKMINKDEFCNPSVMFDRLERPAITRDSDSVMTLLNPMSC